MTTTCHVTELTFVYARNNSSQLLRESDRTYTGTFSTTSGIWGESESQMFASSSMISMSPTKEICVQSSETTQANYIIDVGTTVMLGGILMFFIAHWLIGLIRRTSK